MTRPCPMMRTALAGTRKSNRDCAASSGAPGDTIVSVIASKITSIESHQPQRGKHPAYERPVTRSEHS